MDIILTTVFLLGGTILCGFLFFSIIEGSMKWPSWSAETQPKNFWKSYVGFFKFVSAMKYGDPNPGYSCLELSKVEVFMCKTFRLIMICAPIGLIGLLIFCLATKIGLLIIVSIIATVAIIYGLLRLPDLFLKLLVKIDNMVDFTEKVCDKTKPTKPTKPTETD